MMTDRAASRPGAIALLLVLAPALAVGCAAPPAERDTVVADTSLPTIARDGVILESDMPEPPAEFLAELVRVHKAVDRADPWLKAEEPDREPRRVVLLSDPENWRRAARDIGADPNRGLALDPVSRRLYVMAGVLPARMFGVPTTGPDPRGAMIALYELIWIQRYLLVTGRRGRPALIEQAGARSFAIRAVPPGWQSEARRVLREELAEEYFAIMLGAPRGRLAELLDDRHRRKRRRRLGSATSTAPGPRVTPLAAGLFLREPFEDLPGGLLESALRHPEDPKIEARLEELDERYERYVRDRLVGLLLKTIETEPSVVERRIADAALKLALGQGSGAADAPVAARRAAVARLRAELARSAPPVRWLDEYSGLVKLIARARNPRKTFDSLYEQLKGRLARRRGYHNDAVERARTGFAAAIEREVHRVEAARAPGRGPRRSGPRQSGPRRSGPRSPSDRKPPAADESR